MFYAVKLPWNIIIRGSAITLLWVSTAVLVADQQSDQDECPFNQTPALDVSYEALWGRASATSGAVPLQSRPAISGADPIPSHAASACKRYRRNVEQVARLPGLKCSYRSAGTQTEAQLLTGWWQAWRACANTCNLSCSCHRHPRIRPHCCLNVGSASATLAQHWNSNGRTCGWNRSLSTSVNTEGPPLTT